MKVGIVVPHIFMQDDILPQVIFAPGMLAIELAEALQRLGDNITLYTPGKVTTSVSNVTADLSYFEHELECRGDTYIDLLKKHPLTFITLARQVQAELIAKAFDDANKAKLDVVHVYTNEEDTALPFAVLCNRPVVLTHHDPFNFLVKYKSVFPKYKKLPWLSMSLAQRAGMPEGTNWLANIYHGIKKDLFVPDYKFESNYLAYMGRIIEPKGVHLAIKAIKHHNANTDQKLKLRIAGKHYAGTQKDTYWYERIKPEIDNDEIEYVGFIKDNPSKQNFLSGARALLVPSIFEEPFGMVAVEALACGTPVIGLNSGALPEIIVDGLTGFTVPKTTFSSKKGLAMKKLIDEETTAAGIAKAITKLKTLDRRQCRADFEARFTLERMSREHQTAYRSLL